MTSSPSADSPADSPADALTKPAGASGRPARRLVLLGVLLVTAVAIGLVVGVPDTEELRADVDAAGMWGPVLYAAVYAALCLAPLPLSVVTIAAGLLFGFVGGTLVVMVGASVGAIGTFLLARGLGREAVERLAGARLTSLDERLGRNGLKAMLVVRLIPVIPFAILNYSAGLSAVRTRDYVIGTVVGIVPGVMAYVAIGAYGVDLLNPVSLSVIAVAVLVAAGYAAVRRRRAHVVTP